MKERHCVPTVKCLHNSSILDQRIHCFNIKYCFTWNHPSSFQISNGICIFRWPLVSGLINGAPLAQKLLQSVLAAVYSGLLARRRAGGRKRRHNHPSWSPRLVIKKVISCRHVSFVSRACQGVAGVLGGGVGVGGWNVVCKPLSPICYWAKKRIGRELLILFIIPFAWPPPPPSPEVICCAVFGNWIYWLSLYLVAVTVQYLIRVCWNKRYENTH